MRVAVIANMKAGLEQFIYRELLLFADDGFSISLFPTRFGPGLYNVCDDWDLHRWNSFSVLIWQIFSFLRSPVKYVRLLHEAVKFGTVKDFVLAWYFAHLMDDADVIYATFGDHKLFIGYYCKRILDKPLAVTIHAYELYANNPNIRFFDHALKVCDQIITVSNHNLELLNSEHGIDKSRIEIVRCSVDLEEYRPEKKFVILIVAFFTYTKGHEILFKAVKQLNHDDIEIWVVGDAAGRKGLVDVRALAEQVGIDSQVAFFGLLSGPALRAVYHACDLYCLPCRKGRAGNFEGFPNTLIEAMAAGKPVISTQHAEIPRVIPEIIIEENDVDELAQAIESMYHSPELRERLGKQSRTITEKLFSKEHARKRTQLLSNLATRKNNNHAI